MKRAKKRMLSVFAHLDTNTRRANRALAAAMPSVSASNEKITRKKPKYTLAELIAQSPGGFYIDKDWDQAPPVGRELL